MEQNADARVAALRQIDTQLSAALHGSDALDEYLLSAHISLALDMVRRMLNTSSG